LSLPNGNIYNTYDNYKYILFHFLLNIDYILIIISRGFLLTDNKLTMNYIILTVKTQIVKRQFRENPVTREIIIEQNSILDEKYHWNK